MASKAYERQVRKARKALAKNPVGPEELEAIAARHADNLILKAISGTKWAGAKEYVAALKRSGFQCWHQLPELFRAYEQIGNKAAQNFVGTVPDHCDRIVWRGRYYHLPDMRHDD